jgi:hypothetical protein
MLATLSAAFDMTFSAFSIRVAAGFSAGCSAGLPAFVAAAALAFEAAGFPAWATATGALPVCHATKRTGSSAWTLTRISFG